MKKNVLRYFSYRYYEFIYPIKILKTIFPIFAQNTLKKHNLKILIFVLKLTYIFRINSPKKKTLKVCQYIFELENNFQTRP